MMAIERRDAARLAAREARRETRFDQEDGYRTDASASVSVPTLKSKP
jgi:hypothetical protein